MSRTVSIEIESPIRSLGSVEGRIEAKPPVPRGRFVLRDSVWGGDVACTLAPGRLDLLDGAWGRRAYVAGRVLRERDTSRPLAIDDVAEITLLPEAEPGSLLRAVRGISPVAPGTPLPEDRIRKLRDAWGD